MGCFRIQLLLEDDTWNTQFTIAKITQDNSTSTEWTLLNLDFTVENDGVKLIYDQINTAHADMCFSNITITHSVFLTTHINVSIPKFKYSYSCMYHIISMIV